LYQELKNIAANQPSKIAYKDKRIGKIYHSFRFATKSVSSLDYWYNLFYKDGNKVVPKNITDLLISPLSLAIWYMDDGYRRIDCKGSYLCTSAYTKSEQLLLQKVLKRNFSLNTRLHYAADKVRILHTIL